MNIYELILVLLGISIEGCTVCLIKGSSFNRIKLIEAFRCGVWFSFTSIIMSFLGYFLADCFSDIIVDFSNFIAFIFFVIIGTNMIMEGYRGDEINDNDLSCAGLIGICFTTSINSFAFGIAFSCIYSLCEYYFIFILLALFSFVLCFFGVYFGKKINVNVRNMALIIGGLLVIVIGFKSIVLLLM